MNGLRGAMIVEKHDKPQKVMHFYEGYDARSNFPLGDYDTTISWWSYAPSQSSSVFSNEMMFFGWADSGWGGTRCQCNGRSFIYRYAVGDSSGENSISGVNFNSIKDSWHNYTMSVGSGIVDFYIDGILYKSSNVGVHKNDSLPLSIGGLGRDVDSYSYHRGDKYICGFSIFDRSLTSDEVEEIFFSKNIDLDKGPFNDGMICGFPLTEKYGLKDIVNGNDLVAYNKGRITSDIQYDRLFDGNVVPIYA